MRLDAGWNQIQFNLSDFARRAYGTNYIETHRIQVRTQPPHLTCCRQLVSYLYHTVVTDPTIRQPGFGLPGHTWSLINRFRTGLGPCRADLHKWGLAQSPSCECGRRQTMNHIVDTCPLTKFEGGLNRLHEADDDAGICSDSGTCEINNTLLTTAERRILFSDRIAVLRRQLS